MRTRHRVTEARDLYAQSSLSDSSYKLSPAAFGEMRAGNSVCAQRPRVLTANAHHTPVTAEFEILQTNFVKDIREHPNVVDVAS